MIQALGYAFQFELWEKNSFWLTFLLVGLGSLEAVRRWNYDLFYYLHHFVLVLFLMMLWHATMAWYYIIGGLILYAVDHSIRLYRSIGYTLSCQGLQIVGNDNVVHLQYLVSKPKSLFNGENPFRLSKYASLDHQMGQYVFLNIPAISKLEWHPFTISSSPYDSVTSHHIKVMKKP